MCFKTTIGIIIFSVLFHLISCVPISITNLTIEYQNIVKTLKNDNKIYEQTLLNSTVFPYFSQCDGTNKMPPLCVKYVEMIVNLNSSKTGEEVTKFCQDSALHLEQKSEINYTEEFCQKLAGQLKDHALKITALFQKYENIYSSKNGIQACTRTCSLIIDEYAPEPILKVNPLCSAISDGYTFIGHQVAVTQPKQQQQSNTPPKSLQLVNSSIPVVSQSEPAIASNSITSAERTNATEKNNNTTKNSSSSMAPIDSLDNQLSKLPQPLPIVVKTKNKITTTSTSASTDTSDILPESDKKPALSIEKDDTEDENIDLKNAIKDANIDDIDESIDGSDTNLDNENDGTDDQQAFNNINTEIKESFKDTPSDSIVEEKFQPDLFKNDDDSNFFTFFMCIMLVCIIAYVVYHNKTKVLALLLEGRRTSGGRNGRRKHTASYRKLDTNLEEAISSNANSRTTQIIY